MVFKDINNEVEMKLFGHRLGLLLKGGDVVELVGDVGSGKTTLTKGIAASLGVSENVQSPSFTIKRAYLLSNGGELSHYDFYRLKDAGIMKDELEEALSNSHSINIIEWSEIVKGVLPDDRLIIEIIIVDEFSRKLQISSGGCRSFKILEDLR